MNPATYVIEEFTAAYPRGVGKVIWGPTFTTRDKVRSIRNNMRKSAREGTCQTERWVQPNRSGA